MNGGELERTRERTRRESSTSHRSGISPQRGPMAPLQLKSRRVERQGARGETRLAIYKRCQGLKGDLEEGMILEEGGGGMGGVDLGREGLGCIGERGGFVWKRRRVGRT